MIRSMSWEQVNNEAEQLLWQVQPHALQGSEPVDIESIFEIDVPRLLRNQGIRFRTGSTTLEPHILGYTDALQGFSYVNSDAYDTPTGAEHRRCRATTAHETGHCLLHIPFMQRFISSTATDSNQQLYRASRSELKPFQDPEIQAWKFAGALLMPRPAILHYLKLGKSVRWMAEAFNVNPAFVEVRMSCRTLKS